MIKFYEIQRFAEVLAFKEELEAFYKQVPCIFRVIAVCLQREAYIVATDAPKVLSGEVKGKVENEETFEYLLDGYDAKLGIIGSYRKIYPEE